MTPRASEPRTRWRRASDVRFRVVGDEGVLVRQSSGEAIVVDEIGAKILELLREGQTAGELVRRLETEYEVEPRRLAEDVDRFLDELLEAGVVERLPG